MIYIIYIYIYICIYKGKRNITFYKLNTKRIKQTNNNYILISRQLNYVAVAAAIPTYFKLGEGLAKAIPGSTKSMASTSITMILFGWAQVTVTT